MGDCNKFEAAEKVPDGETNGTEKQRRLETGGGGGIIEQIISLLPVSITGFSEKSSGEKNENRDVSEANKTTEPEGISSLPFTLPDHGPEPEEATILMSIVHD